MLTTDSRAALDELHPEKRSARHPGKQRGNPQALELAAHIAGGKQRGEQIRREVASFVQSLAAEFVAPDNDHFSGALLVTLLTGKRHECDEGAAEQVYGHFADAFMKHVWSDRLLQKVGRRTVLAAAAAHA